MLEPIDEASDIVQIYSQLTQYPIMAPQIRERMRDELFRRGIVRPDRLEEEVKDRAIISQKREGLNNPMFEEDEGLWLQRLRFIRDYLTDFYFAHNLPIELLDTLIDDVVGQRTGVKAAGGIRDRDTAERMIAAGADRIGASASVKILAEGKARA